MYSMCIDVHVQYIKQWLEVYHDLISHLKLVMVG